MVSKRYVVVVGLKSSNYCTHNREHLLTNRGLIMVSTYFEMFKMMIHYSIKMRSTFFTLVLAYRTAFVKFNIFCFSGLFTVPPVLFSGKISELPKPPYLGVPRTGIIGWWLMFVTTSIPGIGYTLCDRYGHFRLHSGVVLIPSSRVIHSPLSWNSIYAWVMYYV